MQIDKTLPLFNNHGFFPGEMKATKFLYLVSNFHLIKGNCLYIACIFVLNIEIWILPEYISIYSLE